MTKKKKKKTPEQSTRSLYLPPWLLKELDRRGFSRSRRISQDVMRYWSILKHRSALVAARFSTEELRIIFAAAMNPNRENPDCETMDCLNLRQVKAIDEDLYHKLRHLNQLDACCIVDLAERYWLTGEAERPGGDVIAFLHDLFGPDWRRFSTAE